MKYLLVIGDGMADNAIDGLGGKTPLEYAKTPQMDSLASAGVLGSVLTVPEEMTPGSDTAILTIFGVDPRHCYGGRASLEAAAGGIVLTQGDIAYRCNMITLEDEGKPFESKRLLSHSAGSVEGDISDTLISELFRAPGFKETGKAAGFEIHPGGSFRHIALQHTGEKPDISKVKLAPPHDHIGQCIGELLPQGGANAQVLTELMRQAHKFLDGHPLNISRREQGKLPANGIWFWAAGVATILPAFQDKYGKTGSVISAVPLCQGIGVLMGLSKIFVPGATGMLDTNYEGKVSAALDALKSDDFAAVHIEAPDECSHDGDTDGKLQAIEWLDSRVISPLVRSLRNDGTDFRMLVISDHKTLLETRGHDGTPVPFIIYDSRKDNRTGLKFCEKDAETCRFIKDGTDLMGMLFDDTY